MSSAASERLHQSFNHQAKDLLTAENAESALVQRREGIVEAGLALPDSKAQSHVCRGTPLHLDRLR